MVADLEIYRRPDRVVASVAPGVAPVLAAKFDSLIFAEDVRVVDVSTETVELTVVGGSAARAIAEACGLDEAGLSALADYAHLEAKDGFVARVPDARLPSFRFFVGANRRDEVVDRLNDAGVVNLDAALLDAWRVEAGRPEFGVDMTTETIPLEAGLLDRAISTTKGCYVGQEVIIRVLHRGGGRVAKRLATLTLDVPAEREPPTRGAQLRGDGRDLGMLTSVVPSPDGSRWIALGYVHRDAAEIGRTFEVDASSITAIVTGFGA
jgi:folate-binding protein YgfZ